MPVIIEVEGEMFLHFTPFYWLSSHRVSSVTYLLFLIGVTFYKLVPRARFFNWGVKLEQPRLRLYCATSAWNGLKITPVIHQSLFVNSILIFPATLRLTGAVPQFWSLLPHTQTPCWAHLQAQPLTHTHMPPQPPLLESSVLRNCTPHSLLECICTPSNTSDLHICTAALTGERWKTRDVGVVSNKEPLDEYWHVYTALNYLLLITGRSSDLLVQILSVDNDITSKADASSFKLYISRFVWGYLLTLTF